LQKEWILHEHVSGKAGAALGKVLCTNLLMLLAVCLASPSPLLLLACLAPSPPRQEDFAARLENRLVSQPIHNSLANRKAENQDR
jgi:hypothetical protein